MGGRNTITQPSQIPGPLYASNMPLRFIIVFLIVILLLDSKCLAACTHTELGRQNDSILKLWNQLTLSSIELEASSQQNLSLKKEYEYLLKIYRNQFNDSSPNANAHRKQFMETYPDIFKCKDMFVIEVVSSGERITYTNIVVSLYKVDSIIIDRFCLDANGWRKFSSFTGRYFQINSDLRKYRSSNGNNFDQCTITHFSYQIPTTCEYFLPWTLTGSIFENLIIL